jgi:hypothetical protein
MWSLDVGLLNDTISTNRISSWSSCLQLSRPSRIVGVNCVPSSAAAASSIASMVYQGDSVNAESTLTDAQEKLLILLPFLPAVVSIVASSLPRRLSIWFANLALTHPTSAFFLAFPCRISLFLSWSLYSRFSCPLPRASEFGHRATMQPALCSGRSCNLPCRHYCTMGCCRTIIC